MSYRLVIFDFDGTLADSFPWFTRVFNEVAERFDFRRLAPEELEALRTRSSREIVASLGVPLWKLPLIARYMRQAMDREIETISLFPGVSPLLHQLAASGVTLAVVTSNATENVRRVLGPENMRLFRYFGCGVSLLGKRSALRRVVRQSGIPREEVLCIGDEIRDAEAAHAEQLAFGAVTWGYTSLEALASRSPEEVFHNLDDILDRVLSREA